MLDSPIPFFFKSKKKKIEKPDLTNFNLFKVFIQRMGIGKKLAYLIFLYSGFHKSIKYGKLENTSYYVLLRFKIFFIRKKEFLDSYIEEKKKSNIRKYLILFNVRGKKHKSGLPVRGQRVKTNAKTAKKLRITK